MESDSILVLQQRANTSRMTPENWTMAPLYHKCLKALEQEDLQGVFVSWMMALTFVQSQGMPYFGPESRLLRGRVNKMPFATNAERREWLDFITVEGLENAGLVPKFEYDPGLKREFEAYPAYDEVRRLEQFIVCCRWGISQMPGIMFWLIGKRHNLLLDFRRFTACPQLQLRVLARWIKKNQLATNGSPEKIFDRFFYESGPTTKESKKAIALALNEGFGEFIASRNLIQCLYVSALSES
jgi:hypothetical protein